MNLILDLIIVAIIIFFIITSAKRGFVRVVIEVAGLIAAMILTFSISTPLSNFTYDKLIEPPILKAAENTAQQSAQEVVQNTWDALPDFITVNSERLSLNSEQLTDNINQNIQQGSQAVVETISQNMIKPVAVKVLGLIFSVILMMLLFFAVKIVARFVNKLFSFSIVGKLNRTLGGVIGAVKGVIFAVFFCALISLIVSFTKNGFLIFTAHNINNSYIFKLFTEVLPFTIF